jgi:hypothetical protein
MHSARSKWTAAAVAKNRLAAPAQRSVSGSYVPLRATGEQSEFEYKDNQFRNFAGLS